MRSMHRQYIQALCISTMAGRPRAWLLLFAEIAELGSEFAHLVAQLFAQLFEEMVYIASDSFALLVYPQEELVVRLGLLAQLV